MRSWVGFRDRSRRLLSPGTQTSLQLAPGVKLSLLTAGSPTTFLARAPAAAPTFNPPAALGRRLGL